MGSIEKIDFENPGDSPIKPSKLAHLVLRTSNMKRLRDFYLPFLGGRVQHENNMLCFITYDEEHHRLALLQVDGTAPKNKQSCGLEHFALTFDTITDLLLAYKQRLKAGIKPAWCVNHGPTISMYYNDPDGNMIEWQVDLFPTAEEANAFLATPEFAVNPIGVDIDPEDLIARIQKGESEETLKIRPNIGPREIPQRML